MALGGLVAIAMPVYFGIAFLIGGADWRLVLRSLKRRKKTADETVASPADQDQQ